MNLFIGTSSSSNIEDTKRKSANDLVKKITEIDDITLVFGAAFTGMMEEVANIFSKANKDLIGVSVDIYKDETDINKYKEIYFEKTPVDRTKKIYNLTDIALFIPGGVGTLAELFTFIMQKDELKDDKLIIIYNKDFFFTPLLEYMYRLKQDNFIRKDLSEYLFISNDEDEIIEKIKTKSKEIKK